MKYGIYVNELCCEDCDYAGAERNGAHNFPAILVEVCPDCGGELKEYVGRWKYTETKVSWWSRYFIGCDSKIVYHGFEKGRVKEIKNLSEATKKNCIKDLPQKGTKEFQKEFNDYCAIVMGYETDMVDEDGDVYDPYFNLHQCAAVVGELINLTGRHPEASIHDANSSTWSTWHDFVISTMPEHE